MFLFLWLINDVNLIAQDRWYTNTSLQMVRGQSQDGSKNNSFYFYNGLRYQAQMFSLSLNLPLVFRGSSSSTQIENPIVQQLLKSEANTNDITEPSAVNDGMMSASDFNIGIGDLYLNGNFTLLKESDYLPALYIGGYVKIPTATSSFNIGTGEFDYQGSLGLRKYFNRFSVYAKVGYLVLGRVEDAEISDPITVNVGLGYRFDGGRNSILLAYDSYSTIIQGVDSPEQISFGYSYALSKSMFITTIVSKGLNDSTSDYTVSGGISFEI